MAAAPRPAPRRERARAATIDEIKHTALDLMRAHGSIDIKFTDIARVMELTPPALYRYFADRDALLNVLIADGYQALGRAVALAREAVPEGDVWSRFLAIAQAYRRYARDEPQLFTLILGMPVAGYVAPEDGPTTEAAQGAMQELSRVFVDAMRLGVLGAPMVDRRRTSRRCCTAGPCCTGSPRWRPTATSTGSPRRPATRCSSTTSRSPPAPPASRFRNGASLNPVRRAPIGPLSSPTGTQREE
ncbi:hypothetical protein GCM10009557_55600 [Virgisporangium ochraceum]